MTLEQQDAPSLATSASGPGSDSSRHATPVVFGGASGAWVGTGVARSWQGRSDSRELAAEVVDDLRSRPAGSAYAFGTLGFRPDAPALFVEPAVLTRGPVHALPADTLPVAGAPTPRTVHRSESPPAPAYASAVRTALTRMEEDAELRKVVLGRWLHLRADPPFVLDEVVRGLAASAGLARIFAVPTPDDSATTLVGASPELLVSRRGRSVRSLPMAGSAPRGATEAEDQDNAAALLASAKDHHEHGFVVAGVEEALGGVCTELDVGAPRLIATDSMWHLATEVQGILAPTAGAGPSALELAQLLHPTPAVCGTPEAAARDLIAELEPDRGALTGAVGWVDAAGNGTFAVTIRAGLLDADGLLRLFAGAGVVRGSVPEREVAETEAKFATMLRGIGVA